MCLAAMPKYKRKFYESSREGMVSAKEIVPAVIDLVKPRSVVDLGCGVGGWLAAFMEAGVEDVAGYDGEWVHLDDLLIPQKCFHRHDLSKPLPVERVFDLAVSVEVAEHLRAECALPFVQTLTKFSNVVLFSAAIPFQGGTNHFNEQWPAYWAQLFAKNGFATVDCLRMKFWNNPQVKWWYAQNIMLFVAEAHLGSYPALMDAYRKENLWGVSLVHPKRWEKQADPRNLRLGRTIKQCFSVVARSFGMR
jgi:SAM-dependent methyltransferase